MSVSRSNVRFASVPALPSRKQGQGFVVWGAAKQRCWAAAPYRQVQPAGQGLCAGEVP